MIVSMFIYCDLNRLSELGLKLDIDQYLDHVQRIADELMTMKEYIFAAQIYSKTGNIDSEVSAYIQGQKWKEVSNMQTKLSLMG